MGKYQPNTDKYFRMILDATHFVFDVPIKNAAESKQDDEVWKNIIFNRDGPREWKAKHPPKTLFVANKLFRPMSEIFSTMGTIEDIAVYMKTFPYGRHRISKLSYLRYHIESFLSEIYILKNRLDAYSKLVERAYKKEPDSANIQVIMEKVRKCVTKALENIVGMRGWHVHRYRYMDPDLDHLSALELLSMYKREGKDNQQFWCQHSFFDQSYKKVRQKKVKKLQKDIKALWDLLESYFKIMLGVVSKKGEIVYPSDIAK